MKQDMMWDKLVRPCRFLLIMSIHSGIPSGLAESEGTEDVVVLGREKVVTVGRGVCLRPRVTQSLTW